MQQRTEYGFFGGTKSLTQRQEELRDSWRTYHTKMRELEERKKALKAQEKELMDQCTSLSVASCSFRQEIEKFREPDKEQTLQHLMQAKLGSSDIEISVEIFTGLSITMRISIKLEAYEDIKSTFSFAGEQIQITQEEDKRYENHQVIIMFPYDKLATVLQGLQLTEARDLGRYSYKSYDPFDDY